VGDRFDGHTTFLVEAQSGPWGPGRPGGAAPSSRKLPAGLLAWVVDDTRCLQQLACSGGGSLAIPVLAVTRFGSAKTPPATVLRAAWNHLGPVLAQPRQREQ